MYHFFKRSIDLLFLISCNSLVAQQNFIEVMNDNFTVSSISAHGGNTRNFAEVTLTDITVCSSREIEYQVPTDGLRWEKVTLRPIY